MDEVLSWTFHIASCLFVELETVKVVAVAHEAGAAAFSCGGGELHCHSSEAAPQGFAGARLPTANERKRVKATRINPPTNK